MNFKNKRIIQCTAIILAMCFMFSGCSLKTHTVIKADYYTDTNLTDKYFDNLKISRCEYESLHPSEYLGKIEIGAMGPAEPSYRGAIFITETEGERLMNDYTWTKDASNLPDLGQVNNSVNMVSEWYVSKDFNQDVFKLGHDADIRFNGKDTIIFTFGTY